MTRRMTRISSAIGLLVALLPAVSGCKKKPASPPTPAAPPRLELKPAATARADLAAQVAVPSFEKTLSTIGEIAAKLGLPAQPADLRRALLEDKGVPPAALEQVDLARPLAVVVLAQPAPAGAAPTGTGGARGDAAMAGGIDLPTSGVVAALALKDPTVAGLERWVAGWAKVRERDRDAISVTTATPDGGRPPAPDAGDDRPATWSGWLLHRDGAVCAAGTKQTLIAGCLLAIEARRNAATSVGPTGAAGEHVSAVLMPEGIARAQGTTLAQALAEAKSALAQPPPATAGATAAGQPISPVAQAWTSGMLDRMAEVNEVRLGLGLDTANGLSIGASAVPRPGSTLAQSIGGRNPFVIDPVLLAGPTPAGIMAMGSSTWAFDLLATMVKAADPAAAPAPPAGTKPPSPAATAKAAKEQAAIDAAFATLRETLAGPASGRMRFAEGPRPELRYDFIYALKEGLDAKKTTEVLDAWSTLSGGPLISRLMADPSNPIKMKVSSRRQGAMVITRMTVDTRSLPPQAASLRAFPLFDGRPIEYRATVDGNRLLLTAGTDTRGGLEGLRLPKSAAAAEPPAPAGALGAALADVKGEDGFYYVDLAPVIRSILISVEKGFRGAMGGATGMAGPLAMAKQAQGLLANVELATWASHRAGDSLTVRWRWPMTTFEAAGGVVRQGMGMMGGAPPTPPAPPTPATPPPAP